MIQTKRIGHATFETPDLERQVAYYQEVVGLSVVGREAGRVWLATETGQLAVALHQGQEARCKAIAFEVSPQLLPDEITKRLAVDGLKSETRSSDAPSIGRTVAFDDIKGTTVELFSEWSFLGSSAPHNGGGTVPNKLGHLAYVVNDPRAVATFYEKTLGFRTSDWIGDYFVFLRCGADHHTVNFIRGPVERMHHMAFELRNPVHLHNACDLLGRKRIEIVWGPVRHGPGHNVAVYHRNPDDQMIEFFIELDRMSDEELGYFEPRPWHRDRPQKPKIWNPDEQRDMWGLPPGPNWRRGNQ